MPLVKVYYPEDLTNKEEFKNVSNSIHHSLMEHFKVPEQDYFQLFIPYPTNQFFYDPFYLLEDGQIRTEKLIYVFITCGPGRSVEQKRNLYHSIAEAVSKHLNISTTDIFITLNETSVENWSFGQGIMQMVKMKGEMES